MALRRACASWSRERDRRILARRHTPATAAPLLPRTSQGTFLTAQLEWWGTPHSAVTRYLSVSAGGKVTPTFRRLASQKRRDTLGAVVNWAHLFRPENREENDDLESGCKPCGSFKSVLVSSPFQKSQLGGVSQLMAVRAFVFAHDRPPRHERSPGHTSTAARKLGDAVVTKQLPNLST
jgi:hypothetical protein